MRPYVIVCGLIFALIGAAHVSQLTGGGSWHLREPDFVLSSFAALGMLGWSIILLIRHPK